MGLGHFIGCIFHRKRVGLRSHGEDQDTVVSWFQAGAPLDLVAFQVSFWHLQAASRIQHCQLLVNHILVSLLGLGNLLVFSLLRLLGRFADCFRSQLAIPDGDHTFDVASDGGVVADDQGG